MLNYLLILLTELEGYTVTVYRLSIIYSSDVSFYVCFRMSAVAYLASYLSRAKFLSAALVASFLQRFGNISE